MFHIKSILLRAWQCPVDSVLFKGCSREIHIAVCSAEPAFSSEKTRKIRTSFKYSYQKGGSL
jgi:hypothetical protein